MKFATIKAFLEWKRIWAPKLVLIKDKNGYRLNGIEVKIGS